MNNPVVFVHGDFLNHTVFSCLADYFISRGHKVFYVDLPGHGLTPFDPNLSNPLDFLKKYMAENNIIKPIFVAHSSGSIIVSDYIEKTANVFSIFFVNPLLSKPIVCNHRLDIPSLIAYFDKVTNKNFEKQELVDYSKIEDPKIISEEGFKTTHPDAFVKLREYYSSDIKLNEIFNLNIPILYVASINDHFIPIEYHEKMSKMMKKPKLIKIESPHNPFVKTQELVKLILIDNYNYLVT